MNHAKYDELVERTERAILKHKDLSIHELAVAITQALMPELDANPGESTDEQAMRQLGLIVKLGAEQHAELTRIVTRMQGSLEKLNVLQMADKKLLTEALARLDALEKLRAVGASFPKDWTVATVHRDSLCLVCKRPKEICICPTLGGGA